MNWIDEKQVSIKDIAREAQVSNPTVSRALRRSPLVNSKTAERILRIAERMGYRPNAAARSLVTKKTKTIGVVVTSIVDSFIGEVVSGIEELANDHGYSVLLSNCNSDPAREIKIVHSFQERQVDGILVTASRIGTLYMPLLRQLKVPIVLVNSQHPDEFVHSVGIDNATASIQAVQHLIGLGHRRIAYLGDQFGLQSDTERFGGYRQALALADFPFLPELVVHGDGQPEGAELAVAKLLALPELPTAIFCYNDTSALGVLSGIRSRGLRVPEDISLVGFDDLMIARYTDPPLTTIRQPKKDMGRMAMEILLKLFSGTNCQTSVKVQGELIIRKSSTPPRSKREPGRSYQGSSAKEGGSQMSEMVSETFNHEAASSPTH